jgi:hypothetical protein
MNGLLSGGRFVIIIERLENEFFDRRGCEVLALHGGQYGRGSPQAEKYPGNSFSMARVDTTTKISSHQGRLEATRIWTLGLVDERGCPRLL